MMTHVVRIEHNSSQPLAVVRRRARQAELSKVVPAACGTVWNVLRSQNVPGAGRHVALYWDDQINLEVGVELEGKFAGSGEVVSSQTPAGKVATTTHLGPYQQLYQAHQAIRQYCHSHGLKFAGASWEIYDHWRPEWNRDPARIRTDVFYLLIEAPAT